MLCYSQACEKTFPWYHWSTTLIGQVSIPTWGQIECRCIPDLSFLRERSGFETSWLYLRVQQVMCHYGHLKILTCEYWGLIYDQPHSWLCRVGWGGLELLVSLLSSCLNYTNGVLCMHISTKPIISKLVKWIHFNAVWLLTFVPHTWSHPVY